MLGTRTHDAHGIRVNPAKSSKACIRQATPQLLEYAYWRDDTNAADDASASIEMPRSRFDLALYPSKFIYRLDASSRRNSIALSLTVVRFWAY